MPNEQHWTEESADAFAHRIAFDFVAQIEDRMDKLPMKQADLAKKLDVSEGAVSKLLNNPQNLTIRTIAKYSRALGMKASIVAYEDRDAANQTGPISPAVFKTCWERYGKPADVWAFDDMPARSSTATVATFVLQINVSMTMNIFCANTTQMQSHQWGDLSSFPINFLGPIVSTELPEMRR
jgi:transcriptional regulator with XRE-family HTH domain